MRAIANLAIVAAMISLGLSVISRITLKPLAVVRGGLEAGALLAFANTCLLIAIIIILLDTQKGK